MDYSNPVVQEFLRVVMYDSLEEIENFEKIPITKKERKEILEIVAERMEDSPKDLKNLVYNLEKSIIKKERWLESQKNNSQ